MGTILIGHGRGRVDIDECHINLWALPGWPEELHYLDIGLSISNTNDTPVESIRLGIPARLPECEAVCLVTSINDLESWQLIFRDCTEVRHGAGSYWHHTLIRSKLPFRMTNVSVEPQPPLQQSPSDFSIWKVSLLKSLPPGRKTYVRLRFRIKNTLGASLGALSVSKDVWLYERVRTYDIRINEIREQVQLGPVKRYFERLSTIHRVYAFVITKPGFTPRVISPTPRYVRSLEATGWESYLRRRLRARWIGWISPPPKLLIYSWQSDWNEPSNAEFRVFASYHRDLGRIDVPSTSIVAVLTVVAIGLAQPGWIATAASGIADFWQQCPVPAYIIAGIVLVLLVLFLASRVVKRLADTVDTRLYEISR